MTVQRSSDSGMGRRSSERLDAGSGAHVDTHPRGLVGRRVTLDLRVVGLGLGLALQPRRLDRMGSVRVAEATKRDGHPEGEGWTVVLMSSQALLDA